MSKGGYIEIYEACDHSENSRPPKVMFRADVRKLNGQFLPKLNGTNVTAQVEIEELELSQQSSSIRVSARSQLSDASLVKLSKLVKPILNAMFNTFLEKFAQFPVPLIEGYECASPALRWLNRTMQIDCDIRVLPNAIRNN